MYALHLEVMWLAILAGFASGSAIGLGFAGADWLGGYGGWRRRLLRLGHIACFGMAFVNLAFAATVGAVGFAESLEWPSRLFIVATVGMPLVCFLAAWRAPLRHLFVLPVGCLLWGAGWLIVHL